jgi:uncharacterized protein YaiE (UPF0345 family)
MNFENVTAVAKANVYFDGKVVSHSILFGDGSKKTLGLIYPGEYHFGTDAAEEMAITDGACEVVLDGQEATASYAAGHRLRSARQVRVHDPGEGRDLPVCVLVFELSRISREFPTSN